MALGVRALWRLSSFQSSNPCGLLGAFQLLSYSHARVPKGIPSSFKSLSFDVKLDILPKTLAAKSEDLLEGINAGVPLRAAF